MSVQKYVAFAVDCIDPVGRSIFLESSAGSRCAIGLQDLAWSEDMVSVGFDRLLPLRCEANLQLPRSFLDLDHLHAYLWGKVATSSLERTLAGVSSDSPRLAEDELLALAGYKRVVAGTWTAEDEPEKVLSSQLDRLPRLHNDLLRSLSLDDKEAEQYWTLEQPMMVSLRRIEARGIKIDLEKAHEFRVLAHEEATKSALTLRHEWDVLNTSDKLGLQAALNRIESDIPIKNVLSPARNMTVKSLAKSTPFFGLLRSLTRAKSDRDMMLRLESSGGVVYPIYDTLGSITGRIQMREPALQFLRKAFRSVISPSEGHTFVHCDYSQFEPGIMASLSGDTRLRNMFNNSDIYSDLSAAVFGDGEHRSICKSAFMAYCNGLPISGLIKLLVAEDPSVDEVPTAGRLQDFFEQFSELSRWRQELELELVKNGRIGGLGGNYRYRVRPEITSLTPRERRWAVNQKVQGTASAVFKSALLRLPADSILVPLHDGALFEIPREQAHSFKQLVLAAFKDALRTTCEDILPRVKLTEWAA